MIALRSHSLPAIAPAGVTAGRSLCFLWLRRESLPAIAQARVTAGREPTSKIWETKKPA
jgi:hypothetical protein